MDGGQAARRPGQSVAGVAGRFQQAQGGTLELLRQQKRRLGRGGVTRVWFRTLHAPHFLRRVADNDVARSLNNV